MCWWVITISSRSSIRWPRAASAALELVERLAGVRAGVDQRQRLVLDQVAVDPSDQERRRQRHPVDPGALPRSASGVLGAGSARRARVAHERITAEHLVAPTLHVLVRAQRLQAQAQQRLGVRGADVEVPVVVVDRDAVEAVLAALGVAGGELLDLRRRIGDLGVDLAGDEVRATAAARAAPTAASPLRESSSRISSAGIVPESAQ